jgi:hypothetical protein
MTKTEALMRQSSCGLYNLHCWSVLAHIVRPHAEVFYGEITCCLVIRDEK